jgi:hypothetical protein
VVSFAQINEKYNSRAKNHCNRKIALLSIFIQLNSFGTKIVFWLPTQKSSVTAVILSFIFFTFLKQRKAFNRDLLKSYKYLAKYKAIK